MPSGRVSPLHMPKLIGRLNQVHYVPVYDVIKKKKKRKQDGDEEWLHCLEQTYMQNKHSQDGASPDALSTYVGVRQPVQMKMVEGKQACPALRDLNRPSSTPDASGGHIDQKKEDKKKIENKKEQRKGRADRRREKLAKLMAVDTTVGNINQTSSLHLPQIMKSFHPAVSRKVQPKASGKSSWIDLTSQTKVRQVASYDYKLLAKRDPKRSNVTRFIVNYDSNPPQKLQRRPLPPLNENLQAPNPRVWLPSESRSRSEQSNTKQPQPEKEADVKSAAQMQGVKPQVMETLLEKLDNARRLNFPNDPFKRTISRSKQGDYWESSTKPKPLRSRHSKRRESDRHFGNYKNGVVLNKLPADFMGNFQSTFQNLEYYLGRVSGPKRNVQDDRTVHIPTGRVGDVQPLETGEDGDFSNHHFMGRLRQGRNDVKIRYAHRDSNDTPPIDHLPWEETKEPRPTLNQPTVSIMKSNNYYPVTNKIKGVKHVTINMPKVPPPSPEVQTFQPESRRKERKSTQKSSDNCPYCDGDKVKKVSFKSDKLADIAITLPTVVEHSETKPETASSHFKQIDGKNKNVITVKRTMQTSQSSDNSQLQKIESQNKLIDKLIVAHGALKRRHWCSKKEVVIAPFKVAINDEDAKLDTKFDSMKLEEKRLMHSTVTKPFTFSYMPSKEKRKESHNKKDFKLEDKKPNSLPAIFNNKGPKHLSNAEVKKTKSSFVSSYVATNQSQEIYDALINDCQNAFDATANATAISLNKATDCDGIDIPITPPYNCKVKGHDQVKNQLLSHKASITDATEQLITV